MHIFGVTPFIKLRNDKQNLNGEKQWKMRWRGVRANPFIGGGVGWGVGKLCLVHNLHVVFCPNK